MNKDGDNYKTSFTVNISTSSLANVAKTHDFVIDMDSQISFIPTHEYEVALIGYSIWNSIKNISVENGNNTLRINPGTGSFVNIVIEDGIYGISELNAVIKKALVALGADPLKFSITGNFNTLKVDMFLGTGGWQVDFSAANSLYKILGFDAILYTDSASSPNKPNITNDIDSLSINTSLIDTRYNFSNARKNNSLYVVPIDAPSGGLMSKIISNPIYKQMTHGSDLRYIDIQITSQDGQTPVNLHNESVSLTLHIREM